MAAIADKPVTPATVAAAQRALDLDLDPAADQHGGPEMKRQLARVLLARALELISADDAGRDA
jgi:aerobic carbon-monoxide dehydrogenase medium subunit